MVRGSLAGPRWVRLPAWPAGPVAAVAVAFLVAGCATVPSGGAPRPVTGTSGQAQSYVLPLPPPAPTSASVWTPQNVVLGFLHASASYAIDPSAARDYLVRSIRGRWHPGSAVTVIGDSPQFSPPTSAPPSGKFQNGSGPAATAITVTVTAHQLATLSQSGQYEYAPVKASYTFSLADVNNVWLIKSLPEPLGGLLLLQSDFEQVYQQRNLYFYASYASAASAGGLAPDLVPDPVYAPIEGSDSALTTTVAENLVRGLFHDSNGWLAGPATWTAFPPGTKLVKPITISNQIATVDLTAPAAQSLAREQMAEQVLYTLTANSGYSTPVANQVQVEINGQTIFTQDKPASLIPKVSDGGAQAFFVQDGSVAQLVVADKAMGGDKASVAVSPGQVGGAPITAVASDPAIQPGSPAQLAVAVVAANGCAVYTGVVGKHGWSPSGERLLSKSGGACSSLSWDSNGYIWASSGQHIWAFQPGYKPVRVAAPAMPGSPGKKVTVLALRMAPDAVRAALLVQTPGGGRAIVLAAVRHDHGTISFGPAVTAGTGLADPLALSWLTPYYLAVLADSGIYEVPLTGAAGSELGTVPSGAETLTTDGLEFVIGTRSGKIRTSPLAISRWASGPPGGSPAFPG